MKNLIAVFIILLMSLEMAGQVVINELECDTPGIDEKEFIELKTASPNVSLDGYVLVLFNGSPAGRDSSYFTLDLDGAISDDNGLLLIGSENMTPFPQLLIPSNIIQNGADAVAIYFAKASDFPNGTKATTVNLIDALVYDTNDADDIDLLTLLGETNQVNEGASNDLKSIQLNNNGVYEAAIATPGQLNDGGGIVFNPITISTNKMQYLEGEKLEITFTSQRPMTADASFSFSLDHLNFNSSDYSGNTTVTIPNKQNTVTTIITLTNDALDEGDEEPLIVFKDLQAPLIPFNNFVKLRIIDDDFVIAPYGKPTNPTYGIVKNMMPEGYYEPLEGKAGLELRQVLQDIIANPIMVRAHSYSDVIEILKQADVNPENSNQVWLLYTEQGRAKLDFQTTSSNVGKWNREHTFPRSHANYNNIDEDDIADGIAVYWTTKADSLRHGNSDAHALRASDGLENTTRNNRFYGDYIGPQGTLGSFKGDVARSVLFMEIRYNGLEVVNGFPELRQGKTGDLETLLEWHRNDPPDDFEMNRNNIIYEWQKNRNPFIDAPNLVEYIWGNNVGEPWEATLGIESFNKSKVKLFPNPVTDKLYVSGLDKESRITIFSAEGRLLNELMLEADKEYFNVDLPSGLYLLKITTKNSVIRRKIIIK